MSGKGGEGAPQEGVTAPDQNNILRETSPQRTSRSVTAIPQLSRSRKNSQEFSPTRTSTIGGSLSTVPSAAAVQRALSAQRPVLQPTNGEGMSEGARPAERPVRSGYNSPSWPTSPRLKSPPPSKIASRVAPKKDSEQNQSNTSLKRLATVSNPEQAAAMQIPEPQDQSASHTVLRAPGRGPSAAASTLETVAESSVPTTPSIGPVVNSPFEQRIDLQNLDPRPDPSLAKDGDGSGDNASKTATKGENGRRSRAPSTSRAAADLAKRSFTSLTNPNPKPKITAEPARMTVETETVTSVPQLLGPSRDISGRDAGSVRTKPSNETIRPKKDKKRSTRKTPSLQAGTVTSKADLFEAKVASAVDEADSSDSDETFVYESNPPDTRPSRHHSRTPSATSLASQDHYGKSKHGIRSGSQAIPGKKSMKFSSNAHNNLQDGESGAEGRGTQRNASSTPRHHHISRHSRPHPSIFDSDSPFPQASKANSPRNSSTNLARQSRPNSPRLSNGRFPTSPRKGEQFDPYDAADDERAPLIGSVRINRARHSRRPHSSNLRHLDYGDDERSWCGRWGGCAFLGFAVLLVTVGIVTFVIALNRPLVDVSIKHIQNVLASEQEIMLDLHVQAINPNLFAITVSDLDVNLFAESPYVGSSPEWHGPESAMRWVQRVPRGFPFPPWHSEDGVDEGTDPIDDPESGTQKMLLGRIWEFDSPLVFEAAPVRRSYSSSVGEIRLAKPGNKTEEGGTARWERVIQHPFDLIVRGVIKYQLPLSSKPRSAKIGSRVKVIPGDDKPGDHKPGEKPGNGSEISLRR